MKTAFASKVLTLVAVMTLAGCSDMKALQQEVADLKSQVGKVQADAQSARAAAGAASGAQSSANQALATAQSNQACCDAVDQKIERAFRQAISK